MDHQPTELLGDRKIRRRFHRGQLWQAKFREWDLLRQIRRQEARDEQAEFMDGLVGDGFVILGGPVGDGEQTLHLIRAADEDEIRARLAADP